MLYTEANVHPLAREKSIHTLLTEKRNVQWSSTQNLAATLAVSTNLMPKWPLFKSVWYATAHFLFKHIELQLEHGSRNDHRDSKVVDFLKKRKQALDLEFTVHAPYRKIDLASHDEDSRLYSCAQVLETLRFCEEMEASRLTVHTGNRTPDGFSQLLKSLDEIVPKARACGVSICLENTGSDRPGWLLLTEEECLLASQQTGCLLTLDLVHVFSANSDPVATLQRLLPVTGNCHLSDTQDRQHLHLPLGFGNLPVSQIFEVLEQSGYKDRVVVDAVEQGYRPETYLQNAAEFRDGTLHL